MYDTDEVKHEIESVNRDSQKTFKILPPTPTSRGKEMTLKRFSIRII